MSSSSGSDREAIIAAYAELDAAFDKVLGLRFDAVTHTERLTLLHQMERNLRRAPTVEHRLIASLAAEASPTALGGTSLTDVLATALRISKNDARRRITDAELLGARTAMTGQPLPPTLPHTAAAQQSGLIGAEHVHVIARFFHQLPEHVNYQQREQAEAQLAKLATGLGPTQLRAAADRLAYLLNQDGTYTDTDRARRRFVSIGKQGVDGMSELTGLLDPEARATLDAVLAKWAAPGMANPDDDTPTIDGPPSPAAVAGDQRSQAQRNHDALKALGRAMLASGQLGQHNGLPATIIVSTTLQELQSAAGHAVTAGGTLLPMSDVIRLASHAHHYLVIFDQHTREPLYLGRSRRCATAGQRIVLHAKDRGCTHPGCTVPGYGCQVHHAVKDWSKGGHTNITDEALACQPHNLLIENSGWTTRKRADGTTEWIPPPHLDTGQKRVNDYHHPQRYLTDDEDEEDGH
jgi:hypothetical protein